MRQMIFRAKILSYGPLPPAAGEARRQYLQIEGRELYANAVRLYSRSMQTVAELLASPKMQLPPSHHDVFATETYDVSSKMLELIRQYSNIGDAIAARVKSVSSQKRAAIAQSWSEAESDARDGLSRAVDALNHLEDLPELGSSHRLVHDIGAYIAGMFGCFIRQEDGEYLERCPVRLAHLRWGFSPGISHTIACSICHEDVDQCEHLIGDQYEVVVARNKEGRCSICARMECDHVVGQVLTAIASVTFGDPRLREVTQTPRPRDPLARLNYVQLDRSVLEQQLGRSIDGEDIRCWKCLEPCSGFIRMHDCFHKSR